MLSHETTSGRVLAYCHDGVGIGHLSRTLSICERIGKEYPFSTFLVATGTPYFSLFGSLPRVDHLKLPAMVKTNGRAYGSKYLGLSIGQLIQCRSALLADMMRHYCPDVLLIDKAPLGVCRELVPAIRWLKENRPAAKVVFGMRDIEDSPEATIEQWSRDDVPEMLATYFDEIWVYGTREVFDPVQQYGLSAELDAKIHFTGYVTPDSPPAHPSNRIEDDDIVVTVGGGTDGECVLRTYLSETASRVAKLGLRSTIIGGPDLPQDVANGLRNQAAQMDGVEWLDFDPCIGRRIRNAKLVVSMGGYNTMCQVARSGTRALIVPRIRPRREQFMRAELWSKRGAVEVVDPDRLTPTFLANHVLAMLDQPYMGSKPDLDFNGLNRISDRFADFWKTEKLCATAVRL